MSDRRALKPDAQGFDRIEIVTVPRYKTSDRSGDEWRISASVRFYRKGTLVHATGCRNIATAVALVGYFHAAALDDGRGYFAGEGNLCDQEGCAEPATVVYRVKREYSRDNPHEWNKELSDERVVRMFCDKHRTRGDCGFDDSDSNYEIITDWRAATTEPR